MTPLSGDPMGNPYIFAFNGGRFSETPLQVLLIRGSRRDIYLSLVGNSQIDGYDMNLGMLPRTGELLETGLAQLMALAITLCTIGM